MKIFMTKTFAALLMCAAFMIPTAKAESDWFFKPYLGADFERLSFNYDDSLADSFLADGFNMYSFHLGARIHRHLGVELGYGVSSSEKKYSNLIGFSSIKLKSWNLDLLGYLPLDEAERLELIGTTGFARAKADVDVSALGASISGREWGWRLGGGFQYHLTEWLSARVLGRWHKYGSDFDADAWSIGGGFNFHF